MARFMQEMQKIEVVVRKEDTSLVTAGANETKPEEAGQNAEAINQTGQATRGSERGVVSRITATKVLAMTLAVGRMGLNYYAGGINYEHGDSALQEAVQRKIEVAEEGASLLASIGMGALFGVRGGPSAMLIGALVGGITTSASLLFKYKGKTRDYNYKVFKEDNAIEYKRARAQLSLTTGRLR